MSSIRLDRQRIRELFDLRRRTEYSGTAYRGDPYPAFQRLRESGPVHEGIPHELIGYDGIAYFHGLPEPGRPHYSVFSYAECEAAYRNPEVFRSSPPDAERQAGSLDASMLYMNGEEHRRHRQLVQPSFVPAKAKWWIANWIQHTVQGLIDGFEADGRAELNVDFDAAIPLLTITGSFGLTIDQALDVRESLDGGAGGGRLLDYLAPIVAARRNEPEDDLISVLCQAELKHDDGTTQRLTDAEIMSFSALLLTAGSGTTWKQLGITLYALLTNPDVLAEVRDDRSLLRAVVEETLRWNTTDPMFSRWVHEDTTLAGVEIPSGAVVHLVIGAADRDPARWDDPDVFDVHRPLQPSLAFASGPHICLGMHVARAEISTAGDALIDRLPNLRLDPDAEPPAIIGMYERGPSHLPVIWG